MITGRIFTYKDIDNKVNLRLNNLHKTNVYKTKMNITFSKFTRE